MSSDFVPDAKLGLYSARIRSKIFFNEGSVSVEVADPYWSQPFLFKSDSEAIEGLTKAAKDAEYIKLYSICRVGCFDPFTGEISDIERKEIVCYEKYEKTVDEAQQA